MTTFPPFPGFDGLMMLSRRDGVDIRPTLLRVLTDLYVQTPLHTSDEERQYIELASRLIDEVDDATRAAVRARLSIYSATPLAIADKLAIHSPNRRPMLPATTDLKPSHPRQDETRNSHLTASLSMQTGNAVELNDMFFAANTEERRLILRRLANAPRNIAAHIDTWNIAPSLAALETMALEADLTGFINELAHVLILPTHVAEQIVGDSGGEALACAARALGMPDEIFQRVLLFLDPELGASATRVFTLSRFYDALSQHAARVMLAAWRGAHQAPSRARHHPVLYDEQRQRARTTQSRTASSLKATQSQASFTQRNTLKS